MERLVRDVPWRACYQSYMLRSAWSVWFETYRGAPAISLICGGLHGAFGSRRTVARLLSVLYAEVCMEGLVRDVPWRAR